MNDRLKSLVIFILFAVIVLVLFKIFTFKPKGKPKTTIQTEIVTTIRDTILSENASLSTIIYEGHKFVMLKNGSKVDLYLIDKETTK